MTRAPLASSVVLATPADLEELALTLWAKFQVQSGEESFTTRDRTMFMAGIAMAVREAVR